MKSFILSSGIGLFVTGLLSAQEVPKFTFSVGGGFTRPVGGTAAQTDTGWNVRGGVGYNFTNRIGANINVGFDDLGFNSTTLNALGATGGVTHVFSATLDPIVHLTPKGHIDFYLTGGGGLFQQYQSFSLPGSSPSYTVNRPGIDIGGGAAFGALGHGKFFAEARYDHIYLVNAHTDYIPVTFGFRW